MCCWLDIAIQTVIAAGLLWYAYDTRQLRKASQEQNEVTQRPCLVPLVRERTSIEAMVWDVHVDGIEYPDLRAIDFSKGHAVLQNIGTGAAFNILYEIQKQEAPKRFVKGRIPYLQKGKEAVTRLVENEFEESNQHAGGRLKLSYESISGQHYETDILTRHEGSQESETKIIVTNCQFNATKSRSIWRRHFAGNS